MNETECVLVIVTTCDSLRDLVGFSITCTSVLNTRVVYTVIKLFLCEFLSFYYIIIKRLNLIINNKLILIKFQNLILIEIDTQIINNEYIYKNLILFFNKNIIIFFVHLYI